MWAIKAIIRSTSERGISQPFLYVAKYHNQRSKDTRSASTETERSTKKNSPEAWISLDNKKKDPANKRWLSSKLLFLLLLLLLLLLP